MKWNKLSRKEINLKVDEALSLNQSYYKSPILGIPGTFLDQQEFYHDAPFLENAPFLKTLISNPNHIGCHTLKNPSSSIFKGTQKIEQDLIKLCSEEIFKGPKNGQDGYVATGGTEANLQALWIYRNYFQKEYGASLESIGVLYSEDTHYSIFKGCNLLGINPYVAKVNKDSRQIDPFELKKLLVKAQENGIKYFIVVINLSTTMFGSVDEIDPISNELDAFDFLFKIHIDAAFGGFIYPFIKENSQHDFSNSNVSSISIDGHKMLQTPYGTGLFLIRKGYMHYAKTEEAQYVPGLDFTICGSRSGANAVVIWMLLMTYGSDGWKHKMLNLIHRTDHLCKQLDFLGIKYFRNPNVNIVTIYGNQIPEKVALKYELVADTYEQKAQWWKIVVMDHVSIEILDKFLAEVESEMVKS